MHPASPPPHSPSPPLPSLPPVSPPLILRGRVFPAGRLLVMAIVNRTSDSFYPAARSLDDGAAAEAVARAVEEGADLVDVGGVRAGPGDEVTTSEELHRVVPFVARIRAEYPDLPLSVDTWRAEVADAACAAGADLVNDTWAGYDPRLPEVAGAHAAGLVCSHTGGARPRTLPGRVVYGTGDDGVVDDVVAVLTAAAARAVTAGVPVGSVLLDPTFDFGKTTGHGLSLLRNLTALTGLGYPVLVSLSRKDLVGETLDLPVEDRLEGTLAATAVAAWSGAKVFRAHDVAATRRVLDMVASIRGDRPPARPVRGLA